MPRKGCLIHTFNGSSSGKHNDDRNFPSPPGEPLTTGEVALVESIFGDEIKTKRVRLYFPGTAKPGTDPGYIIPAQTFGKYSIKFYSRQYHSVDYSRSPDAFKFGTFIHEMTHIWQNQQNVPCKTSTDNNKPYDYKLTPQSAFSDFSWEQQARIIENYALENLYPIRPSNPDPLLQKVVEDRFPQARLTRLRPKTKHPAIKSPKVA